MRVENIYRFLDTSVLSLCVTSVITFFDRSELGYIDTERMSMDIGSCYSIFLVKVICTSTRTILLARLCLYRQSE